MTSEVIRVEGVSKQYRLGKTGTGTLSHDLNRWWHQIRGKEDPYLKIGEVNDRTRRSDSGYVWALRDINFSVQQGEVLGIIGRNGAGKSTLLKILSRTTLPTTGSIKTRGRIASLLEVGTGFHPEMTGRENIFMNGAILGMRRREIQQKLDEIIDFSGVEAYIDTPVKRYSSGMYVRLAFAVAAHLESEILIVDEVLAVGDAEFQVKCIGKMNQVSKVFGKTIILVSHNLSVINDLCNQGLIINKGQINFQGDIAEVIGKYYSQIRQISQFNTFERRLVKEVSISGYQFLTFDTEKVLIPKSGQAVRLILKIQNNSLNVIKNCSLGVGFFSASGNLLMALRSDLLDIFYDLQPGEAVVECKIPQFPLSPGLYKMNLILENSVTTYDWIRDEIFIEVGRGDFFSSGRIPAKGSQTVLVNHEWISYELTE